MTVSTTVNRQDFIGTGSVGPISFPHRVDAAAEVELWQRGANGERTLQAVFNSDFFVALAADFESATVTLSAAYAALVNGKTCSILRVLPLTQALNVEQVQRFSDGDIEKGYDRSVMRDQQLSEFLKEIDSKLLTVNSLQPKESVKAATTANIVLSGLQTVDTVVLAADDRVLVKNNTNRAENGIRIAAVGAWPRAADMDTWAEVPRAVVGVTGGSVNSGTAWLCTSPAGGTLDASPIDWFAFEPFTLTPQPLASNRIKLQEAISLTVGSAPGSFFSTLQDAWDFVCESIDLNGHIVTLQLQDGTHEGVTDYLPGVAGANGHTYVGGGYVKIRGNAAAPQNVIVTTANIYTLWFVNSYVQLEHFEPRNTNAGGASIAAAWRGVVEIGPGMRLGASTNEKMHASSGGQIRALVGYTDVGNAATHAFAGSGGQIRLPNDTVTLLGTPAYSAALAYVTSTGIFDARGTTFSGAATGKPFVVEPAGLILRDTNNLADIPGNVEGELQAGALYDEIRGPLDTEVAGSFPAAATLDIPVPVWAKSAFIDVQGVSSNTAARHPIIRASQDNGSSFPTGYNCSGLSGTPALLLDDALVSMFTDVAAARNWDYNAVIDLRGGGASARFAGVNDDVSAVTLAGLSFGAHLAGSFITHLRFMWNGSGNFDAGTYSVRFRGW